MNVRVLFALCLHARLPNHKSDLTDSSAFVVRGCGSVLLWRRCDMLRTSVFADDAIFSCTEPDGGVSLPQQYRCSFSAA